MKLKWETEFKETEIGEIPKDWEVKRLGDIVKDSIVGSTPLKRISQYWKDGEIPWLTNKEVEYGKINFIIDTELKVSQKSLKETNLRLIPENSLIISFTASVGKVAINKVPITTNQQFISFILNENSNVFYYGYYFVISKELIESFSGATPFSFITKEKALLIPVPSPSLPEQTRIATVLSWFDDLIENKKRQNKLLEKTAMAIFKSWFIDFEPFKDEEFVYNEELGREIPKGWEVKRFGQFVKIESGGNAPQGTEYLQEAKYPFIRVKHLSEQPCISDCDFINEKAIRDYKLKLFKERSILFQKSGESLSFARVNLLPFDAYIVNHLGVIDSSENPNLEFVYFVLKDMLKQLIEERSGTALPYLKISDIQNKMILLPPTPLLQHFHSLVEPLFQKIILNQKQIMTLRKIRDALLPLLVFGKLRVVEL